MKALNTRQITFFILGALVISLSATSCSKSSDSPGGSGKDYGTHNIDPQLKGEWMWTSSSDVGSYDENGTWNGSGYGFAYRLTVDAKGNGKLYSHIFSDIGYGSYLSVDIYYDGYYNMDSDGNLIFYSMGGRYVSSSGTDRALEGDEIYNPSTGTGRTVSFPAVNFTTQNSKPCFTINYSDGESDVFFKQ